MRGGSRQRAVGARGGAARWPRPGGDRALDQPPSAAAQPLLRIDARSSARVSASTRRRRSRDAERRSARAQRRRQLGDVPLPHARREPGTPAKAGRACELAQPCRRAAAAAAPCGGDAASCSAIDARRRTRPCARTTISAAADGVGARRSATKSAMVTSVSWPTAEITGTGAAGDRPRHDLLVERPQIFDRSAAAADDHDVDARRRGAICRSAARDVERRALALHARRAR